MSLAVGCFAGVPIAARGIFGDHASVAGIAFGVGVLAYVVAVWRVRTVLDLRGLRSLRRRPHA
jgi:hypothetical protein